MDVFESLHKPGKLQKSNIQLISYSRHRIIPKGQSNLVIDLKKRKLNVVFQVVDDGKPILGRESCEKLGLITRNKLNVDIIQQKESEMNPSQKIEAEFLDLYDEIDDRGFGYYEYDIQTDSSVDPVIMPPRRVPVGLSEKFRKELDRVSGLGVIKEQKEPTEWVSQVSITTKSNGDLRICLDPHFLNTAVKREHYPMNTIEEIATRMPKAKVISKVDARTGYWQIKLSKRSSLLTTFITPYGRYRFTRMPFGLCSSGEIWQRAMNDAFGDLEGVEIITDDILVWGETQEEHDQRLRKMFE